MIAVVQRVKEAEVSISGKSSGRIGTGLCILLGVAKGDNRADADYLTEKISGLRIFGDARGRMQHSLKDVSGEALVVPQFTLCGNWRKGRRPGFAGAAPPEDAERLYDYFCEKLREEKVPVETGEFAAMMQVSLVNDGPVTFVLDTKNME
jgi:D-tyrosyl-tRNA(Tyr) deacylase